MRLVLDTKQTELTAGDREYLQTLADKLAKQTPWDAEDYPLLTVDIKKQKLHYDGSLDLVLPKKRLIAHFQGKTVKVALKSGFSKLLRELDKYKGMHFRNDSEYFARNTVKRAI